MKDNLKQLIKRIWKLCLILIKWFFRTVGKLLKTFPFRAVFKALGKSFIWVGKEAVTAVQEILEHLRKRLRFSIVFKLTVVYAWLFSMLLLFVSTAVLLSTTYYVSQESEIELEKSLEQAIGLMDFPVEASLNSLERLAEHEEIILAVYNSEKELILNTKYESTPLFQQNSHPVFSILDDQHPFTVTKQIRIGQEQYFVQASKFLHKEQGYVAFFLVLLGATSLLGVLGALWLGSKASRKMLLPIEAMTQTTRHISGNRLDMRLDVSGAQDELKDLAETINQMLNRIQLAYQIQNQFVSDASHELRTPIAVIQGYSNMLDRWGKEDRAVLEESIQAIKDEAESMKDLIEKLLFLARGDKNLEALEKADFKANELIEEVVRETQLIDTSHKIVSQWNEPAVIHGDRQSIKQLLRILIDNSIKFTPANGIITINLVVKRGRPVIQVMDTGIGMKEEDIPYIFDRFYQADKARSKRVSGQGLGLSIAKWIADQHQARFLVESVYQQGTTISIIFC